MNVFTPTLSEEILNKYNFFELYPFDGGGHFVNDSIVHSTENLVIVDNILNHNALQNYGSLTNLDFHIYDNWSNIEQSCWINRLYFIVPLSKYARDTKNKELADLIVNIILRFNNNPKSKEETLNLEKYIIEKRNREYNRGENLNGEIDYSWFDFQVASRIIHILYSLYFIKDLLSESEEIDNILYSHGQVIAWSEEEENFAPGNHEALRGLALIYLGKYFNKQDWIDLGVKVCKYHILNDFLEDGMNLDISPSYHFFECWILRDIKFYAYDLLNSECKERIDKAFKLCFSLAQPDGYSSVISDGYPLDMNVFLHTLNIQNKLENKIYLENSKLGICKDENHYFILDSSPLLHKTSHFHGGKQSFIWFFKNKSFFVDSGCSPYDNENFATYYKQSFYHSSMLVNGVGDSILQGQYTWNNNSTCKISNWNENTIESELTSNVKEWENIIWKRKIIILNNGISIDDYVENLNEKELTFIFNLDPQVKVSLNKNQCILENYNVKLEGIFTLPVSLKEGLCYKFKEEKNKQIICNTNMKICKLNSSFIEIN